VRTRPKRTQGGAKVHERVAKNGGEEGVIKYFRGLLKKSTQLTRGLVGPGSGETGKRARKRTFSARFWKRHETSAPNPEAKCVAKLNRGHNYTTNQKKKWVGEKSRRRLEVAKEVRATDGEES